MKRTRQLVVKHIYHGCTFTNISASGGSSILQGNSGTNAVNGSVGNMMNLNEQEREMLRLFRLFSTRQQTSEMLRWYELTDNLKGVCTNAEKE